MNPKIHLDESITLTIRFQQVLSYQETDTSTEFSCRIEQKKCQIVMTI